MFNDLAKAPFLLLTIGDSAAASKTMFLQAVSLFMIVALLPSQAKAAGAVAVGQVGGFSYSAIVDSSDAAAASQTAVEHCRSTKDAKNNDTLKGDCKVIQTFSNKCAAMAWDPAPNYGTVGVGWAVADDLATAQSEAISKCKASAKPGRADSCVVNKTNCDGSAIGPHVH